MTVFEATCVLVIALSIGYYFGRCAGSTTSSRKKRPKRSALERLAVSLLALMIERFVQRKWARTRGWLGRVVTLPELFSRSVARPVPGRR